MSCILFLSVIVSCLSCGNTEKQQLATDMVSIPGTAGEGIGKENVADIKFEEEIFDFGTITQGEKVSHDFIFKNTGKQALIISSASADCGCTVAEVPNRPIAPGETSKLRITFDSSDKTGMVTKSITLLANCIPNRRVVKIKANIFVPQSN